MGIIRSIRRSLRAKLMIAFIAVGGAAVLAIGAASYGGARSTLLARSGELLQAQAEDAIDKIDRNLAERRSSIRSVPIPTSWSRSRARVASRPRGSTRSIRVSLRSTA